MISLWHKTTNAYQILITMLLFKLINMDIILDILPITNIGNYIFIKNKKKKMKKQQSI